MKVNNPTIAIWAIFMAIVAFFSALAHFGVYADWIASVFWSFVITLFVGLTFIFEAIFTKKSFFNPDFSFKGKDAFPKAFTTMFGIIAILLSFIVLFSYTYTIPEGFNWLLAFYHIGAVPVILYNLFN